ncbi:hypothetical protein DUNSADRAFT_7008 [Dunaliella salina]|uniref:Encoded protein n=1 Tax=Dunaliella salina TaxID=3046 RepID=A0ABQ7GM46_DUNSA|nr:hypothetical protein DUNSADRAFT_7008 [Dunaliella salina]|eukprot:KAF5835680.1 hypothetical protein DUNSADRAFT_7008 [Dunaliella salina]
MNMGVTVKIGRVPEADEEAEGKEEEILKEVEGVARRMGSKSGAEHPRRVGWGKRGGDGWTRLIELHLHAVAGIRSEVAHRRLIKKGQRERLDNVEVPL